MGVCVSKPELTEDDIKYCFWKRHYIIANLVPESADLLLKYDYKFPIT